MSKTITHIGRIVIRRTGIARTRWHGTKCSSRQYSKVSSGYEVNADAEPLSNYQIGGYHPVHLNTQFKYGRYRTTHKLGWGGEGTVWLARDLTTSNLVALKVLVAEESGRNQESALLRQLFPGGDDATVDHPGTAHLTQLLDYFWLTGPNGTHECLVIETAGTNVQDQASEYPEQRVPAPAAWSIAKQTTLALDRLHKMNVGHGDLHTRNIMLSPSPRHYSDPKLLTELPRPYVADVNALPPNELTRHMPKYLVESTNLPFAKANPEQWHAQLVDFGQSFESTALPRTSRTPLVLRAPELLLTKSWDHRIDIWSLACTMFELVTGQPPFDPVGANPNRLVQDWKEMFGDLPDGWRGPWEYTTPWGDDEETSISDLLKQTYFGRNDGGTDVGEGEEEQQQKFTEEHLDCLGDLLQGMFRYRPEERLNTGEILGHRWFSNDPFQKS